MLRVNFEINEELYRQAESVFDDAGIDSETAVRMFFKRVVKEGSFAFLLQDRQPVREESVQNDYANLHISRRESLFDATSQNSENVSPGDKNIAFYSVKNNAEGRRFPRQNDAKTDSDRIRKNNAVRLLLSKGYDLYRTITFASKNTGAYNYWANPDDYYVKYDWSLILNDWMERKLYLFNIPAGSISDNVLVPRADKPDKIDLQIMYNDVTFTDNRSGFSFAKYLVGEVNY